MSCKGGGTIQLYISSLVDIYAHIGSMSDNQPTIETTTRTNGTFVRI